MADQVEKVIQKTVGDGGILSMLYFDIHGTNPEGIQQLGVGFMKNLQKEPGVVFTRGEIAEPLKTDQEETDKNLYSTSVEVKILTKSYMDLLRVCGKYSPFSVEILEPMDKKLGMDDMIEILMYASTTTFEYKKHIFQKTSSKEDYEQYLKHLKNKVELGKRLMEQKK